MNCCRKWLKEFPYNKDKIDFITLPYPHTYNEIVSLLAFDEVA